MNNIFFSFGILFLFLDENMYCWYSLVLSCYDYDVSESRAGMSTWVP